MNTRLLRMARRDTDGRSWDMPNGIPPATSLLKDWTVQALTTRTHTVYWPARDSDGSWMLRGARFDWHGRTAFREIRKLLRTLPCNES